MEYKELYKIIAKANELNRFHSFIIKTNDNKTIKKRLFISSTDNICEFYKRSRSSGYIIPTSEYHNWTSCEVISKHIEDKGNVKKFLLRVIKYLEKSGMWSNMLSDYKKIIELGDDFLTQYLALEWQERRELLNKHNISIHVDTLEGSAIKGIKCINFDKYDKEYLVKILNDKIKNKEEYSYSWRKGYDNSVWIKEDNGILRGWYSEEYKNCGNGHYYLMIDATHAIFCEDD